MTNFNVSQDFKNNMTILRIVGLGLILIFGCKNKIGEFIVDNSHLSYLFKYEYGYNELGKKNSMILKQYTLMHAQIVDSSVTKTIFEYNDKGLLTKEISHTIDGIKPDIVLYNYDSNDSLIAENNINSENDTVHMVQYGYFPDGRKILLQRDLIIKLDQSKDFKTAYDNKTYDTILYTNAYFYENNRCKHLVEYDKNKKIANEIQYEYKNDKIFKEDHYSYIGDLKMYVKTKFYDYSKNQIIPDSYSLDKSNDTIDFTKNFFKGKDIDYTLNSYEKGSVINNVFYKNGREVESIDINKQMKRKAVYLTTYYDNGDIKEERFHREKINAH